MTQPSRPTDQHAPPVASEPPEATASQRWQPSSRYDWLLPGIAGASLLLAVLLPVLLAVLPALPPPSADAVTVSPAAGELPRLGPIVIRFRDEPRVRDAAQLISFEPTTEASYVWADDRTLLMQPAFPGLLRGGVYHLRVAAAAAGLEQDFEATFTVEGKLTVEAVIPGPDDTRVPTNAEIYVQFSRSVAPLTVLQDPQAGPAIEFDPPIDGAGEWLNTSIYRFRPERLQSSTTYQVRIPAGLTSADDGVLEEDYVWSFETVGPSLVSSTPADNTRFVPRGATVTLNFDQSMDRQSVVGGVTFEVQGGDAIPFSAGWNADSSALTLSSDEPLTLSTRYVVRLAAGLRDQQGGTTERESQIRFTTSDPPRLLSSEPRDGSTSAGRWGITLNFNNPMDLDSIEERLSITGIDLEQSQIHSWDDRSLNVGVVLQPSTEYTVTIADGAVDREGLALGPVSITFTTGRLEPSIHYAAPGQTGVYSAREEAILYFYATNTETVDFELRRMTEERAATVLRQSWQPRQTILRDDDEVLRRWTETVEGAADGRVLGSTSLGDGEPLERGYYYVFSPNAPQWNEPVLVFAVTDTSIVTKLSDSELLVWVLDSRTGEPVGGVDVTVTGSRLPAGGETIRTDADGLASMQVASRREMMGSNTARAYAAVVSTADRFGIARTNWQHGAYVWQLGLPIDWSPRHYVGHLYTDRPIYRPGETVHYKAVVRIDEDARYRLPDGETELRLRVYDARYEQLEERPVTVNAFGTLAAEFTLADDAAIGLYHIQLLEPGPFNSEQWIAGTTVSVAEFRRPEFEVDVIPAAADAIDGDGIEVTTEARFFFGGPVTDATATWSAYASPAPVSFSGYERYSFRDWDFFYGEPPRDPFRGEGSVDISPDGTGRFTVATALRGGEQTQEFTIGATVTDNSGQAIANSARVRVHPAQFYAGISTERYVATAGEETTFDVVTLTTSGDAAANRPVTLGVYERVWITIREQTDSGARRYRSEPRDTLLRTISVTTDAEGRARIAHTPESAGTLRLVVETADPAGRTARAAAQLWVTGEDVVSWYVPNNDLIELVADRDEYQVGDVAEVLVPAPFPGATGLVTIERGGILQRFVQTFEGNSEVLRVPIENAHVPNVFVSVVLLRAPTADDPLPRYHIGYAELPVSAESRRLNVSIETDNMTAQPGDVVEYRIHVTDSNGAGVRSELSMAVVDQAVLSLREESGPDGMGAFWFRRGLAVETASSLSVSVNRANDLISEPDEGGKGGGFDADGTRGDFRNTAHWEGQVVTDATGRATVQVRMPDNLTTWRTQVRAVSGDTLVGESVHELLVTRPLLLRPALPRFLRVGDEAQIRVLVRNGSDAAESVEVTLEADGVRFGGSPAQTRTIPAGASVPFSWPASVTEEGTARITFRASSDGEQDAVTISLPVYLDVTPETVATGGVVTDETAFESVYLPAFAITDRGSLDVAIQASLIDALTDELVHLRPLPYESNVRIASRVIATINARRAEGMSGEVLLAGVRKDLSDLIAAQRVDGGWGWCRADCSTSTAATAWVLIALGEAREAGATDVGAAAERASSLVRNYVDRPSDVAHPATMSQHAYMLYALQHGTGTNAVENRLRSLVEQHRGILTPWGRAHAILGLIGAGVSPTDPLVRGLVSDLSASMEPTANGNQWQGYGSLESNAGATALVLQALTAADPAHPFIDATARWLTIARAERRWETDITRAQAIRALGRFAEQTQERQGDYAYHVTLDQHEVLGGRFQPQGGEKERHLDIPLRDIAGGQMHHLAFARETGPGRLYYGLLLRYVTPAREIEALNRGVGISRQYTLLGDPDRPVNEARLGDVVRVTITVMAPVDRQYLRVDDYLPAGLEGIDTGLETVPEELRRQLEAERQRAADGETPPYFAPWYRWYWSPWEQASVHDDRYSLFASRLGRGVYEYVYYARATTPGDFFVAPIHAYEEAMPDVFGRSDSGRFIVRE